MSSAHSRYSQPSGTHDQPTYIDTGTCMSDSIIKTPLDVIDDIIYENQYNQIAGDVIEND